MLGEVLALQPSFLFTKNGHVDAFKIMSISHNEQENNLTNNVRKLCVRTDQFNCS